MAYTVTEDSGLVTICTVLSGLFEIEVVVDLTTVDNSALGKNQWSGICNKIHKASCKEVEPLRSPVMSTHA